MGKNCLELPAGLVGDDSAGEPVEVFLGVDEDPRWDGCTALRLRVADDGVGATAVELDRRSEGHLGLALLSDRIADLGGELTITGGPAGGLVAEARVPAQAAR